ncbi:MAG: c-type cytochrome biogenesis protein CcmF [Phenylobacterium sp. RIFCSPHIGHO2_01_FULL_69_31]|jgi:cytochrome c-type biogenesis protein CcmF|uniref:heme lyase CcmF/NrfE family subunit n=1 Tax=Phenylobacterium sp. RIFCSPHIGHO2_01_FULL_69_31 TaxID=1801944 RepID=UPI0008B36561|nr:heme lyase CcmF/NrfE family subunit [Phenylobacterium sp. RIFCSPHIGHO2_01_FULL_69_31]OHB26723.1 MAG: c-type cytochrome biogenesis protein CcmF [Phenylobacterium sp. RIFCSPHIGHO2_01_FULL_69_31]
MLAEVGQFALILALLLSLVQSGAPLWGAHRGDGVLMAVGRQAALLQGGFVSLAFVCLAWAYVTCDFSVALVARHSHTTQPLAYRFAATWGSHEGSMLLWVLILAIYGAGVAFFGGTLRETLQARVLGVQGVLGAAFLGFLLFTSNPFLRLSPAPAEGTELNPLLQDPGLVMHPPLLYLGYVGFSVAFCFAVAALIEGRVDAAWARWVRPWVLAAWIPLTAGITLGSAWAYYELGWGGWWFWDPVENASLMPWLLGTALLHSALVLERRGALVSWTILLAILTFSLSLVGTFLVRSGILTSVHAFAVDPQRGVYILGILAATTGLSLALYSWRAPAIRSGALFQPLSREGGITLNNLFLTALTATVFLGTFSPVFIEMINGDKISVGPPYYAKTFSPLAVPLLFLVVFGPMLNWKRDEARKVFDRVRIPAIVAGLVLLVALPFGGLKGVATAGGLALSAWLILGSVWILGRRWWSGRAYLGRAIRTTPRSIVGLVTAHAGLGLLTLGITGVTAWDSDKVLNMKVGDSVAFAGRTLTLTDYDIVEGPNYQAKRAQFAVKGPMGAYDLRSEKRWYPSAQSQTTEAGIRVGPLGNLYVSVGEESEAGVIVRLWDHPLIVWIWIGGFVMSAGGAVSLSDRRVRVGAAVKTLPVGQPVAAE